VRTREIGVDDFLIRALLAALGVAIVAGPFGCFVVWRRLSYFGETLAHTALLGVALGLVLGIDLIFGMIVAVASAAVLLALTGRTRGLGSDTVLGILASLTLAGGLVAVGSFTGARLDLLSYLFGDILAVRAIDVWVIWASAALGLGALLWFWRPLLSATVDEELARIEGLNVAVLDLVLMVMLALVVAIAGRLVGILLVVALLIIPPATARRLATTPERMAALSALIGALAVVAGLWGSFALDIATGPSIVLAAGVLCILAWSLPNLRDRTL
jgi:zinc transport system permease protein